MNFNVFLFWIITALSVISILLCIFKFKCEKSANENNKKLHFINKLLIAIPILIPIITFIPLITQAPVIYADSEYISDFNPSKKIVITSVPFFGEIYYTDDLSDPQTSMTMHKYNSEEGIIVSEYDLPKVIHAKWKAMGLFWSDVGQLYVLPSNARGGGETNEDENNNFFEDIQGNPYVSQETTYDFNELPDGLHAGWGDNGDGRESYTIEEINSGLLGDRIIFNTISDSVIGDEKNFVGARIADGNNNGISNVWNGNLITAEEGKIYYIRLYCHNNSLAGEGAIAKNVEAQFIIPGESGKTVVVNGMFRSENSSPSEYWDSVVFTSDKSFHLEYITGSAFFENNGIGSNGGIALDDKIVNGWVKLGYNALDGNIPGCYEYASYTSIMVKPVFD